MMRVCGCPRTPQLVRGTPGAWPSDLSSVLLSSHRGSRGPFQALQSRLCGEANAQRPEVRAQGIDLGLFSHISCPRREEGEGL